MAKFELLVLAVLTATSFGQTVITCNSIATATVTADTVFSLNTSGFAIGTLLEIDHGSSGAVQVSTAGSGTTVTALQKVATDTFGYWVVDDYHIHAGDIVWMNASTTGFSSSFTLKCFAPQAMTCGGLYTADYDSAQIFTFSPSASHDAVVISDCHSSATFWDGEVTKLMDNSTVLHTFGATECAKAFFIDKSAASLVSGNTYWVLVASTTILANHTIGFECHTAQAAACADTFTVAGLSDLYSFEMPAAGPFFLETCGTTFSTVLSVADSTGTEVAQYDDDGWIECGAGLSSEHIDISTITAYQAGQTYYAVVLGEDDILSDHTNPTVEFHINCSDAGELRNLLMVALVTLVFALM